MFPHVKIFPGTVIFAHKGNNCKKWQSNFFDRTVKIKLAPNAKTSFGLRAWPTTRDAFHWFHKRQPNFEHLARFTIILRFSRWQCLQGSCNANRVDIHHDDCSSSYRCWHICNKTFIQKLTFCWKCSEICPFLLIYSAITEVFSHSWFKLVRFFKFLTIICLNNFSFPHFVKNMNFLCKFIFYKKTFQIVQPNSAKIGKSQRSSLEFS